MERATSNGISNCRANKLFKIVISLVLSCFFSSVQAEFMAPCNHSDCSLMIFSKVENAVDIEFETDTAISITSNSMNDIKISNLLIFTDRDRNALIEDSDYEVVSLEIALALSADTNGNISFLGQTPKEVPLPAALPLLLFSLSSLSFWARGKNLS